MSNNGVLVSAICLRCRAKCCTVSVEVLLVLTPPPPPQRAGVLREAGGLGKCKTCMYIYIYLSMNFLTRFFSKKVLRNEVTKFYDGTNL